MATQALGTQAQPTKYYFAYGSNLHLRQMKRRCANSKYIGRARLSNYRWQINERGYANVVEAEGYWVEGLVYEINEKDEGKLDVNEGVSKNAYTKQLMTVLLYRAQPSLYRRPVAWIVDKGGPVKASRLSKARSKSPDEPQHWNQEVLVYISLNYTKDSDPKDEYVNRVNFGLSDAKALGMDEDYIRNFIRPCIPERTKALNAGESPPAGKPKQDNSSNGVAKTTTPRNGERFPARKVRSPARPNNQILRRTAGARTQRGERVANQRTTQQDVPPPLPPRPRVSDTPIITVEEYVVVNARRF